MQKHGTHGTNLIISSMILLVKGKNNFYDFPEVLWEKRKIALGMKDILNFFL